MEQRLTTGQAGKELGISGRTVLRWIGQGHLNAVVTPTGRKLIAPSDLANVLRPTTARKGEGE